MRALTLAVILFLLAASVNIVKEAYGYSYQTPSTGVDVAEVEKLSSPTSALLQVYNALKVFGKIIYSSIFLGETIKDISPWRLPSTLIYALDGLGLIAYGVALVQIVRGIPGGGLE